MSGGAIRDYTPSYNFGLINFDFPRWHTYEWNNWKQLDALLTSLGAISITGLWTISTSYNVGDRVVDGEAGTIWLCAVAHTSGTGTFSAERAGNPGRWTQISSLPVNRGTWTTAVEYNVGDILRFGNAYYFCNTAHTATSFAADIGNWTLVFDLSDAITAESNAAASAAAAGVAESNAYTSSVNAANSATSANTSAVNAGTSASGAAGSASSAGTSATNAANSASAANTSASNAATSATNAANSATAAGNSATAAANSAAAAATFNPALFLPLSGGTMTGTLATDDVGSPHVFNDFSGPFTVQGPLNGTTETQTAGIQFLIQGKYGTKLTLRGDGFVGLGGGSAAAYRWYVNMTNGDMTASGKITAGGTITSGGGIVLRTGQIGAWTTAGWSCQAQLAQGSGFQWLSNGNSYAGFFGMSGDAFYFMGGPDALGGIGAAATWFSFNNSAAYVGGSLVIHHGNFTATYSQRTVIFGQQGPIGNATWYFPRNALGVGSGYFSGLWLDFVGAQWLCEIGYHQYYWNGTWYNVGN